MSDHKTQITSIDEGFDFLGQHARKFRGQLLITPSKRNVKRYLATVRGEIKKYRAVSAGVLIVQLNPIIRGWANYHRHVASKRVFATTDHAIFWALWRWAVRRHPNKSRRWVADTYFRHVNSRKWMFFGELSSKDNTTKTVELFHASSVPIKRHSIVKEKANPYDPEWASYFDGRSKRFRTHSPSSNLLFDRSCFAVSDGASGIPRA